MSLPTSAEKTLPRIRPLTSSVSLGLIAAACLMLPAIGSAEPANPQDASTEQPPEHEHHAPHGGTLVVLGEEFAHLELVLDSQAGRLTAYALDGEAEQPIRVAQPTLELIMHAADADSAAPPPATLSLNAVGSVLTGETAGDTSEFSGQSDLLKGTRHFAATLAKIQIKGQDFHDVPFQFPEGNEHEE